jgi:hypothetical protein
MTAQEPEILIYNGEKFSMISNPSVDGYVDAGFGLCTANYRGYVGIWEIKDDKLYLVDTHSGWMKKPGPIFADWVSQELSVWKGNLLHYVHAGYGSVYEEDMFFNIQCGVLKGIRTEDNTKKYKEFAIAGIETAKNKHSISYLYSLYLDPKGELSRLIEKSSDRKDFYIGIQKELEIVFKKKLNELAKDPNSGIVLQYKENEQETKND